MVISAIHPPELQLDYVENGKARILAHWNADGTPWNIELTVQINGTIFHQYEEKVIIWTIKKTFMNGEESVTISNSDTAEEKRSKAELYISLNAIEIMNFAQGSEFTF